MGGTPKKVIKRIGWAAALVLTFPSAALAAFGRLEAVFAFFAQALSLAPGLPGSYLRVAYYAMTLNSCGRDCHIGLGSFFAHPQANLGHRVYIGSLCILGQTNIGDRTQIAS